MIKRGIVLAVMLGIWLSPLTAKNTFELLTDVGTTARMIALGSMEGFDESAAATLENPAALNGVNRFSARGFYTSINDGISNFYAYSAAYRLPNTNGVIGLGVMQIAVPDVAETGATFADTFFVRRSFTYSDSVVKVAYAWPWREALWGGVGVNYLRRDILNVNGSGWNMDLGVRTKIKQADLSFSAKHPLGLDIRYNNGGREAPPSRYVLGARLPIFTSGLDSYLQLRRLTSKGLNLVSFGLGYTPPGIEQIMFAGSWQQVAEIREVSSKLAYGIYLDIDEINVSFTYEQAQFYKQGAQFYFTVGYDI